MQGPGTCSLVWSHVSSWSSPVIFSEKEEMNPVTSCGVLQEDHGKDGEGADGSESTCSLGRSSRLGSRLLYCHDPTEVLFRQAV